MALKNQFKFNFSFIRSQKSNIAAAWNVTKFAVKSIVGFLAIIFIGDAFVAFSG